jgi:oligopeptidase B
VPDVNESAAPAVPKRPTTRTHHGDVFVDDYEWLRDKSNPDAIAYLEAENAYTDASTAHLAPLRQRIFDEIKARTLETDLSVPVREGAWWYFTRSLEGKQYPVHVRVPAAGPDDWTPPTVDPASAPGSLPGEQVVLDQNVEAVGHEFFSLGAFDVSTDGALLLYATDVEGDERYTLRVRSLADEAGAPAGTNLPDEIPNTSAGSLFAPDGEHVFYTTMDDAWRPDTVWRHRLGTASADDALVFHEPDEKFWLGVGLTRSREFLVIELGSKITSEAWVLDAEPDEDGSFGAPRVVWPRREGVEYTVEHAILPDGPRSDDERKELADVRARVAAGEVASFGTRSLGALLVLHNGGNGPGKENFELALTRIPGDEPLDPADAVTVIPSDPAVRLEDVDAFANRVVVSYRRDGISRLGVVRVSPLTGPFIELSERDAPLGGSRSDSSGRAGEWQVEELEFDQPLFTARLAGNPEFWASPTIRVGYTSFVDPASVYDIDLTTGERHLRKRQPVLPGPDGAPYDASDYVQLREWATADDGTRVPVSLVWKRRGEGAVGLDAAGTRAAPAPLLLYGYGSYETSIDPTFSIPRLSLLDRGVVFAVAHVRGGGELGRRWYDDGKELTKRNTFTDFVAVARHLVDTGWTTPDRLVAEGRSAGGLLMGAVANLAPELFAGIHAGVPFVDALTSILDPSLPLTVVEWDEWGDPLHDADVYAYMKSYTPYENVRDDAAYPRILATTSLNDTRVLYVEPAKWTARLRDVGAPVLLKTEMSAGHGGVSGRYARWEELAFEDAWVLDVLGRADVDPTA